MKAFWTYTLARFVLFAVTYAAVWLIAQPFFESGTAVNILILLIALLLSSVISIFALAGLRDKLAHNVQERAARMTLRVEEARRAEDVD